MALIRTQKEVLGRLLIAWIGLLTAFYKLRLGPLLASLFLGNVADADRLILLAECDIVANADVDVLAGML